MPAEMKFDAEDMKTVAAMKTAVAKALRPFKDRGIPSYLAAMATAQVTAHLLSPYPESIKRDLAEGIRAHIAGEKEDGDSFNLSSLITLPKMLQ